MDRPSLDAFLASLQMVGSAVLRYLSSVQQSIADKLGFVHPSEPTELDQVAGFVIPFIGYVQTLYDAVPKTTSTRFRPRRHDWSESSMSSPWCKRGRELSYLLLRHRQSTCSLAPQSSRDIAAEIVFMRIFVPVMAAASKA